MTPNRAGIAVGLLVFVGLLIGLYPTYDAGDLAVRAVWATGVGLALILMLRVLPRPTTWKQGVPFVIAHAALGLLVGTVLTKGGV